MRWFLLTAAALGAGGCKQIIPNSDSTVSLQLDIPDTPNATLAPKGYTQVDLRIHSPTGDLERTVAIDGTTFDFGTVDAAMGVSVEAVLRNASGTAVGYGRSAGPVDLEPNDTITVPVRRPIAYIAGQISVPSDPQNPNSPLVWTEAAATFDDLSTGAAPDGTAKLGQDVVLMVSAGPSLFLFQQGTSNPNGDLTGNATVLPVSTSDHSIGTPLTGTLMGGVIDGAGSDDGRWLVVGTTTGLYIVDTMAGTATSVASGAFERVAVVGSDSTGVTAVAVMNRTATTGTCSSTAQIYWVTAGNAKSVATGGFADVAASQGSAYYVDACKGALGTVSATGATSLRTNLGKPTALAVSDGQAYVGVETPGTPAYVALMSMATAQGATDMPRTLWSEPAQQVLEATDAGDQGVQRELDSDSAVFDQLEVGAGGDYVAATITAHYTGPEVVDANFPAMDIDADELLVTDAATGAFAQRYRSWCDGVLTIGTFDIPDWKCATSESETAPTSPDDEHRIESMTFIFGEK